MRLQLITFCTVSRGLPHYCETQEFISKVCSLAVDDWATVEALGFKGLALPKAFISASLALIP